MSCAKSEHFFEMVNGIASHNISDFNDVQNHVFINKDIFEFKKGKFSLLSMIESEPYHSSEIFEKSRSPPGFKIPKMNLEIFVCFFNIPPFGISPKFSCFFQVMHPLMIVC